MVCEWVSSLEGAKLTPSHRSHARTLHDHRHHPSAITGVAPLRPTTTAQERGPKDHEAVVNAWWNSYCADPTVLHSALDYIRVWLRIAAEWTPKDPSSSSPVWHLKALHLSAKLNPLEAAKLMGRKISQV